MHNLPGIADIIHCNKCNKISINNCVNWRGEKMEWDVGGKLHKRGAILAVPGKIHWIVLAKGITYAMNVDLGELRFSQGIVKSWVWLEYSP